jgi:hypothetical protein
MAVSVMLLGYPFVHISQWVKMPTPLKGLVVVVVNG